MLMPLNIYMINKQINKYLANSVQNNEISHIFINIL